jgi:hypothetical protein
MACSRLANLVKREYDPLHTQGFAFVLHPDRRLEVSTVQGMPLWVDCRLPQGTDPHPQARDQGRRCRRGQGEQRHAEG